jgi:glycosyltransferase involved in cell wall biosynthesis
VTDAVVVHDWLAGYHGAERVADVLVHDLFPGSPPLDLLTFHAQRSQLPPRLAASVTAESGAARAAASLSPGGWRYLLPLMPLYFRRLDLRRYGLVLSSSHSFALHARAAPGALHVCYCHTPVRYAWLPPEAGDRRRGPAGVVLRRSRGALAALDRRGAQAIDSVVANSTAVQERIAAFWGREAVVVHPPVDVHELTPTRPQEPEVLWVQRLVPHKRPELVVDAFRGLPYRLTMVGVGFLERSLRRSLPPNVELLSWLDRRELVRRYESAACFVHVGEEDFGISMVEALAAGTPVVAVRSGGARDIVRDGVDGVLLAHPDAAALREAVVATVERDWDVHALARRAAEFSRERFLERLRAHLATLGV